MDEGNGIQSIRNIALASSPGAGKSSLAEALAYTGWGHSGYGIHPQGQHSF